MPANPIPKPKTLPARTSRGVCAFSCRREDITNPAAIMRTVIEVRRVPFEDLFNGNRIPITPQMAALWILTL